MFSTQQKTNLLTILSVVNQNRAENAPLPYKVCKLYHYNYNPAKKWLLVFSQWNVQTNKLHRRVFTTFNNVPDAKGRLREARLWEKFINEQLIAGKVYDPSGSTQATAIAPPKVAVPTFKEDFAAFTAAKSVSLSPTTIDAYNTFFLWWERYEVANGLSGLLTAEITPALCQGFQDYLIGQALSNKTRNNYVGTLKAMLNYYCKPGRNRFAVSPALHVENLPVESESDEPFSAEQVTAIVAEIEKREDWQLLLFVYLIHYTLARPGNEIRLLKVKDIKERTVNYRVTNVKSNAAKSPTMSKKLIALIDRLGIRDAAPDEYVFTLRGQPGAAPVGNTYFYKRHREVLRACGIEGKYTLYSWKYTGNINLYLAGVDLKSIQGQNGHTTLRTTEKYLGRLGVFVNNDIYEKFN